MIHYAEFHFFRNYSFASASEQGEVVKKYVISEWQRVSQKQ